jgi:hypothetical protein
MTPEQSDLAEGGPETYRVFDLDRVDQPEAELVATLLACNTQIHDEFLMPSLET